MESYWKTPYVKGKKHFIGEYLKDAPSFRKTFEEKVGIDFADTIVVREPVEKGTEIIEKEKVWGKNAIKNKTKVKSSDVQDPLDVLKLRLAKGKISKKEFKELRKMIES